jgi:hypothetical protein
MNRLSTPIFLMMLLLCRPLWAEDKNQLDANSQTDATHQADSMNQADMTNKVERFLLPITQWIESAVHNSPLIRLPEKNQSPINISKGLDLRSAIKQANERYPGTVLNAEKQTLNGVEIFHIRIISQQGIIKTITIGQDEFSTELGKEGDN